MNEGIYPDLPQRGDGGWKDIVDEELSTEDSLPSFSLKSRGDGGIPLHIHFSSPICIGIVEEISRRHTKRAPDLELIPGDKHRPSNT